MPECWKRQPLPPPGIMPKLATQSGPMLVIDGNIHPRFEENGTSRHIRNGVGADGDKRAVFAISRGPVSLGSFARLFRDALGCRNALFFDGTVSALHDGTKVSGRRRVSGRADAGGARKAASSSSERRVPSSASAPSSCGLSAASPA